MPAKKLLSASYTVRARRKIVTAATFLFGRGKTHLHFEHDCWWAFVEDGRVYAVVDAIPGIDHTGIDFERT